MVLAVLAISAAYVGWHLFRGWMPFDDGMLGQTAVRVIHGELPHRDFDDVYTGGLAFLNAAAFQLFGTALSSLRLPLFAMFVAWVPAVNYIASRLVRPAAAAAVTLLAVIWSLPNYTAAMPSWYNLFLATFGVAALLRHLEDGRRRWLFAAGVAGGLSLLIKVIGLYYVAGVLLFLVFRAHALARAAEPKDGRRGNAYALFVSGALLFFVASLLVVVRREAHAPELVQFVLPATLLALLLARNEWTEPAGPSAARFRQLAHLLAPFLIGVALPVALFLIPYARSGSVAALLHGVFVLPMKRFGFAVVNALPLWTMFACVPLGVLVLASRLRSGTTGRWVAAIVAASLSAILVLTVKTGPAHHAVWYSVQNLVPIFGVIGVVVLWRERAADLEYPLLRQQLAALLSVTALCSLVQFPYFVPIYFCYVAPLVLLTAVVFFRYLRTTTRAVPAMILGFYALFGIFEVNTATLYTMGAFYATYLPTRPLRLVRGGIEVPTVHADIYERVIPLLRARARGGYTWASPDSPEIYFLSGLKNPTRTLYDFFDDTTDHTARTLRSLERHGVTAIVMNRRAAFSPPFNEDIVDSLEARYPYSMNVGNFHLRWR
jgi:hypothetical protein